MLLVVHLIYFSQISDMRETGWPTRHWQWRVLSPTRRNPSGLAEKTAGEWNPGHRGTVRKRNDLLFIVVTDMQSLRTHILKPSVLVSHLKVMTSLNAEWRRKCRYQSRFSGAGFTLFTPIYDENHKQIGVVAIGLS